MHKRFSRALLTAALAAAAGPAMLWSKPPDLPVDTKDTCLVASAIPNGSVLAAPMVMEQAPVPEQLPMPEVADDEDEDAGKYLVRIGDLSIDLKDAVGGWNKEWAPWLMQWISEAMSSPTNVLGIVVTELGLGEGQNPDVDVISGAAQGTACNDSAKCAGEAAPKLTDFVAFSQRGISDAVLVSMIRAVPAVYVLNPDDVAYLKDNGVSSVVITALKQSGDRETNTERVRNSDCSEVSEDSAPEQLPMPEVEDDDADAGKVRIEIGDLSIDLTDAICTCKDWAPQLGDGPAMIVEAALGAINDLGSKLAGFLGLSSPANDWTVGEKQGRDINICAAPTCGISTPGTVSGTEGRVSVVPPRSVPLPFTVEPTPRPAPPRPAPGHTPQKAETYWESNLKTATDKAHDGKCQHSLVGRVWLYDQDNRMICFDGTLTVKLFDVKPAQGGPEKLLEQWNFDKASFLKSQEKDCMIGWGYTIFLPTVTANNPNVKHIRLEATYLADGSSTPIVVANSMRLEHPEVGQRQVAPEATTTATSARFAWEIPGYLQHGSPVPASLESWMWLKHPDGWGPVTPVATVPSATLGVMPYASAHCHKPADASDDDSEEKTHREHAAKEMLEIGKACQSRGDFAMARNCFEEVERLCPGTAMANTAKEQVASLLDGEGGVEASEMPDLIGESTNDVARIDEANRMFHLAAKYETAGDTNNAYLCYADACSICPACASGQKSAKKLQEMDAVKAEENKGSGSEEQEPPLALDRTHAMSAGDWQKREEAHHLYQLGEHCRVGGDLDMALSFYREARELSPNSYYGQRAMQRISKINPN